MKKQLPKIPADYQVGVTWLDDSGKRCTTIAGRAHKSGKRIVELVETTFAGTSAFGAMHYYARLQCHSPGWVCAGEAGVHGGYGGKAKPNLDRISIDAERKILPREKDASGERLGRAGDLTVRFLTPAAARSAAIALFKERFGPGWILLSGYCADGIDEPEILAET